MSLKNTQHIGKLQDIVPVLSTSNYPIWSRKFSLGLKAIGASQVLSGPDDEIDPTFDEKIHAVLLLSMGEEIFPIVENSSTTREAWNILETRFGNNSTLGALNAIQEVFCLRQNSQSVSEYVARAQGAANNVARVAADFITINDNLLALILLMGVSEEYQTVVDTIDASTKSLSSIHVIEKLQNAECRRSARDKENSSVLAATAKQRDFCRYCNCAKSKCWKPKCFHLHPELKKKDKQNDVVSAYSASHSEDPVKKDRRWLLDSGCNRHICNDISALTDLHQHHSTSIKMGDDHETFSTYTGTSTVSLGHVSAVLRDSLYVPNMGQNLMSVGVSTERGLKFWFDGDVCQIFSQVEKMPEGTLVKTIPKTNNLYYMDNDRIQAIDRIHANVAGTQSNADIVRWHLRLKHGNYRSIQRLQHQNLISVSDNDIPETPCRGCAMGKMTRGHFQQRDPENISTKPLQRVYADLCGPFPVAALGSRLRYVCVFIDEFSRFIWAYLLERKSDAAKALKIFIRESTRFSSNSIEQFVCLQTDNGGEFMSSEIRNCLSELGIIHQTSIPYDHEQQGMVERPIRTIMEAAECMRLHANLPQAFWGDSVAASVYIYNRFPHSALNYQTPYEKWFGRTPTLSHMRVFGCKAWIHRQNRPHPRLTPKSSHVIFIGYAHRQKAYRFWNFQTNRSIVSRDAIFDESSFVSPEDLVKDQDHSENIATIWFGDNEATETMQDRNESTDIENGVIQNPEDNGESTGNEPYQIQTLESAERNQSPLRRSGRTPKPRDFYVAHHAIESKPDNDSDSLQNVQASTIVIPNTLSEALESQYCRYWKQAADEEFRKLVERNTWKLAEIPSNRKAISCRWVFAVKSNVSGGVTKFKARLVVRGFSQRVGIDFDEVFSPVAHSESQRLLLALTVNHGLKLRQADVISAYLNGNIDTEIYMDQPDGFRSASHPNHFCMLQKGLYGLKQAGHIWNNTLNEFLTKTLKFTRCKSDPCFYFISTDPGTFVLLTIHVDDMLFAHNNDALMQDIMEKLHSNFGITDLGKPQKVLGIRVNYDEDNRMITIDQQTYIGELLAEFNMTDCKPASIPHQAGFLLTSKMSPSTVNEKAMMQDVPYRKLVGSLNYIATHTRPDISYAVNVLCQFMANPGREHWTAAKLVLRYLKGTCSWGIKFSNENVPVEVFSDSDFAGDLDQRRSTSGCVCIMSGAPIIWRSQRQKTTAESSLEAEYIALNLASRESKWLKQLLEELPLSNDTEAILIKGDNQGSLSVANNNRTDRRTKHIDIKYHAIRDRVSSGTIRLEYCPTEQMVADFLTKPINKSKFVWCRDKCGITDCEGGIISGGNVEAN